MDLLGHLPTSMVTAPVHRSVPETDQPDYHGLVRYLEALAFPSRLEILHRLRIPHALSDIRVSAARSRAGEREERVLSRQAVRQHLDKLVDLGLVVQRQEGGAGRFEYVANSQRLYEITEEFRLVGSMFAGTPVGRDATISLGSETAPIEMDGPHLVIVHGFREGKAFPLHYKDLDGGRGWIVGREEGLHVSLDYDPFVSMQNSEILPGDDGFHLLDLRTSRNGTRLNWRTLKADERAELRSGDIISVGRSALVFRTA